MRHVLIIARADVVADIRDGIDAATAQPVSEWLPSTRWRRSTDPAGVTTYRAANVPVPNSLWVEMLDILNTATQGVRDSVNWQGKPATAVEDARWAVAYDGTDVVAAYYTTTPGQGVPRARAVLTAAGFVPIWSDANP